MFGKSKDPGEPVDYAQPHYRRANEASIRTDVDAAARAVADATVVRSVVAQPREEPIGAGPNAIQSIDMIGDRACLEIQEVRDRLKATYEDLDAGLAKLQVAFRETTADTHDRVQDFVDDAASFQERVKIIAEGMPKRQAQTAR